MIALVRAGQGQIQEPRTTYGSLIWVLGAQVFKSSFAFPGTFSRSWIGSRAQGQEPELGYKMPLCQNTGPKNPILASFFDRMN